MTDDVPEGDSEGLPVLLEWVAVLVVAWVAWRVLV
jgi:hypothetical protein